MNTICDLQLGDSKLTRYDKLLGSLHEWFKWCKVTQALHDGCEQCTLSLFGGVVLRGLLSPTLYWTRATLNSVNVSVVLAMVMILECVKLGSCLSVWNARVPHW